MKEQVPNKTIEKDFEEYKFKVPFSYNIKPKEVIDMCMKEQDNIILTYRLEKFINMVESNNQFNTVFNNDEGQLLLQSFNEMKKHYEK